MYFTSYFRLFNYMVSFPWYFTVCITYQPPLVPSYANTVCHVTEKGPHMLSHKNGSKAIFYYHFIVHVLLQYNFSSYRYFINNVSMYITQQCLDERKWYEVSVTWYWQGKTMQTEETLAQCHTIYYKSQTECHGIKPKLLQW